MIPPYAGSPPPALSVGPQGPTGATGTAGTHLASMLVIDAINSTAVMAATGLSVPVAGGKRYAFTATLFCEDSVDADGFVFDFDTSAPATNFRAWASVRDTVAFSVLDESLVALASDVESASIGAAAVTIYGSYEPSASGNLVIRFAQAEHTTGTLTLHRGSNLILWEVT